MDERLTIRRLLVANRGEIARRIFRTCRDLDIETVAVYSDPDRRSPHVAEADHAASLHGVTSADTYLSIEKVLDAARRTEADAIHPGYGFLSENADFAQAVIDTGLIWVGPSPESIRAMADKIAAKALVAKAGVPILPSATVEGDDDAAWAAAAEKVGYPLLVKAAAGGGGKGMTRVDEPRSLADAVAGARRVAKSSFGDSTVFLERCLVRPRHVEVQVLGDTHGTVQHLFTRDCSVQRRHQKVIEEAPAPGLADDLRDRLHESAVAAAKTVDYVGAGTVEFLVAGDEHFFLEMNTRLQVEHPVTEEITGEDLVEAQLRIASGGTVEIATDWHNVANIVLHSPWTESEEENAATRSALALTDNDASDQSEDGTPLGHAIEARLYAEDPADDFLPSMGRIERFTIAGPDADRVRIDSGVEAGAEVSQYYDPMLAKVICFGDDRDEARRGLIRALRAMQIHGVTTNRDSLVAVLEHDAFAAGDVHTAFFDDHPETVSATAPDDVVRWHAAAAALALRERRSAGSTLPRIAPAGWRNVIAAPAVQRLAVGGSTGRIVEVACMPPRHGRRATLVGIDGEALAIVEDEVSSNSVDLEIDGIRHRAAVNIVGDRIWVNDGRWQTEFVEVPRFTVGGSDASAHGPSAPVPGTVVAIEVAIGDEVREGQTLVVVEAMKMEHRLAADVDGTVTDVRVTTGDKVDAHQVLVLIDPADDP